MVRRKRRVTAIEDADAAVDAFMSSGKGKVSVAKKTKRNDGIAASRVEKATNQLDQFMKTGDWSQAKSLHFVALYSYLHERVYGLKPILSSQDRKLAMFAASHALKAHFNTDPGALADFMLWSWRREYNTVKWRKANNRQSTFRIGWRYMFGGSMITDYLLATKEDD